MKFTLLFLVASFSFSAHASVKLLVNGTITSQYQVDKNNIAEETERSFSGSSNVAGQLYGEKLDRKDKVETNLKATTQFVAPKTSTDAFRLNAQKKMFVGAAKEILATYVERNRKDGLRSHIKYSLENSDCERFGESIICETRLTARLTGRY